MPIEWRNRSHFAEVAEALGVRTCDVLAMVASNLALFTTEEGTMLWSALLRRDEDGILRVTRKMPHPGKLEKLRKDFTDE